MCVSVTVNPPVVLSSPGGRLEGEYRLRGRVHGHVTDRGVLLGDCRRHVGPSPHALSSSVTVLTPFCMACTPTGHTQRCPCRRMIGESSWCARSGQKFNATPPPFSGGATEFRLIVASLPQAFATGSPKAPATGFENLMGYAGNHHRFR